MAMVNNKGEKLIEAGKFNVYIGGSLPSLRSETLGVSKPAQAAFTVK
jgi:beta-glucosidase